MPIGFADTLRRVFPTTVASYPFFCWTQIRTTGTLIDCRRPKV